MKLKTASRFCYWSGKVKRVWESTFNERKGTTAAADNGTIKGDEDSQGNGGSRSMPLIANAAGHGPSSQ